MRTFFFFKKRQLFHAGKEEEEEEEKEGEEAAAADSSLMHVYYQRRTHEERSPCSSEQLLSLLLLELLEGAGSRADRCMWHCGSFLHKGQNLCSYGSAQWTSNPANLHVFQCWTDAAVFLSCSDGVNGGVFLNMRSQVSLSITHRASLVCWPSMGRLVGRQL